MMTQAMRRRAVFLASVYPTILVLVSVALDWAEDLEITTSGWLYLLGWLVLFVNGFYRERRQMLRKVK
jgi:hypothetical protein